jgi:hypothetical protein
VCQRHASPSELIINLIATLPSLVGVTLVEVYYTAFLDEIQTRIGVSAKVSVLFLKIKNNFRQNFL